MRARFLVPSLGMVAVFAAAYAWVKPTNFGGTDEWLYVSLVSRNVLDIPYANRPLVLLWTWPGGHLVPHSLWGYYLVHGAYLALTGVLTGLLCRRLAPESRLTAFLAGALSTVWAPLDYLRLDTVLLTGYSGFGFGTFLAVLLFLDSWRRRSVPLLALAALFAIATAQGFEGALSLLLAASPLLAWIEKDRSRRFWAWVTAWTGAVGLATTLAVLPLLGAKGSYQVSALGFDAHPLGVLERLERQYGYHLLPLVTTPLRELLTPAVPVALFVFALAYFLVAREGASVGGPEGRGSNVRLLVVGLVLAALAYAPFTLSPRILMAARTQVLSAPGIGMLLAALIVLLASRVPPRGRQGAALALSAWVVALGTARTVAMQREWDEERSRFSLQNRILVQLTRLAPRLSPHTLVVLLDESEAFWATFTFRHALEYLYEREATGLAWGAKDFLYPTRFAREGVFCDAWPVIRRAWDSPATFHRYDEIVVVRRDEGGELALAESWPNPLPPLPPGAVYDPRARIRGGPLPPERGILHAVN